MFKRARQYNKNEEQPEPALSISASWPVFQPKSYIKSRENLDQKPQNVKGGRTASDNQRKLLITITFIICWLLITCVIHRQGIKNDGHSKDSVTTILQPSSPLMRGWQPPLVDRHILEKLDRLSEKDDMEDDCWERLSAESFSDNSSMIPLVKKIPEVSKRVRYRQSYNTRSGFLKTSDMKFLLPWIGEQESKARLHLMQLAHLTSHLNRTLVLPNISKGRMGTCMKTDFRLYYDAQTLASSMPFTEFIEYVAASRETLTGSLVTIDSKAPNKTLAGLDLLSNLANLHADAFTDVIGDLSKAKHNNCLKDKIPTLQTRNFSPIWLSPKAPQSARSHHMEGFAADLVAALNSPELFNRVRRLHDANQGVSMPDVIVVEWNLRHPVFLQSQNPAR